MEPLNVLWRQTVLQKISTHFRKPYKREESLLTFWLLQELPNLFPLPSFSLLVRSHRLPHTIFLSTRWSVLAIVSSLHVLRQSPPVFVGLAAARSLPLALGWELLRWSHWASLQAKTSGCHRRRNDGWRWLRPVETSACVHVALVRHDVNLMVSDRCDRFIWRVWLTNWKAEWNGVCFKEREQPDSLLCPHHNRSQERTRCQASGGNGWGYVVNGSLSACLHLLL